MSPRIPNAATLLLAMSLSASFAASAVLRDGMASGLNNSDWTAKHVKRQSIIEVPQQTIAALSAFTNFAGAALCDPSDTLTWNCGSNCDALPTFRPNMVGGDGVDVPFWYVGYWPDRNAVIVAHQGTDVNDLEADLIAGEFTLESLDAELFPGISSSIQVHSGFAATHASSADDILAAVTFLLASQLDPFPNSIVTTGVGLGAALALLDNVFLNAQFRTQFPNLAFNMIGYGMPRVGNEAFATHVDGILGGPAIHVNNEKDVIPILPPISSGFHHSDIEYHIEEGVWLMCPGHDNPSTLCIVGAVPSVSEGDVADNAGPYNGITIEC